MSSIPTSLKEVSHLYKAHQALTQGTADPEHIINQLPESLRQRIQNLPHPGESSRGQQLLLSIRDVTQEIYRSESNEAKAKIHTAFYRCFNKSNNLFYYSCNMFNTTRNYWVKHHINDENKIEPLLRSLEIIAVQKELQKWAGSNYNRQIASNRIMTFMSGRERVLDLSSLRLTSLPDIFDNATMRNRLKFLYICSNQLKSLPESLTRLSSLKVLYAWFSQLQSLPDLSGLTSLIALEVFGNQLQSLPDLSGLTSLKALNVGANPLQSQQPKSILKLPTNCKVLLPKHVTDKLREKCENPGYRGPRICFCYDEYCKNLDTPLRSLDAKAENPGFIEMQTIHAHTTSK